MSQTRTSPGGGGAIPDPLNVFVVGPDPLPVTIVGGAAMPTENGFRLTGLSLTPVQVNTLVSSTIFLTPYLHDRIALWNGSAWEILQSPEVSLAVTGRTTDLPFDIFAFSSGGNLTLEFLNWSTATARATALVRLNGVWVLSSDNTRRYVGSCRPRSATTFEMNFNGGITTSARADLWNANNRVVRSFNIQGSGTWNYSLATWRQAAGTAAKQIDIMVGLAEDSIECEVIIGSTNTVASVLRYASVGIDGTTGPSGLRSVSPGPIGIESLAVCNLYHTPAIGRHFYAHVEWATASGVTTWLATSGQSSGGMVALWPC